LQAHAMDLEIIANLRCLAGFRRVGKTQLGFE
jgi:hypothetical protein